MERSAKTTVIVILAVIVILTALTASAPAYGQAAKGLEKQLTLPKDAEKPDPPLSSKEVFGKLSGGVLLEVILYEDGSILGFEKRTLQDVMDRTTHAKRLKYEGNIRNLFSFAASLGGTKKVLEKEGAPELADVDLVIHAAPGVPFKHLFTLIRVACEEGIQIYRFHIVVKDEETGKKGLLTYFFPALAIGVMTPEDKERLAAMYSVGFMPSPNGLTYSLGTLSREGNEKTCRTLEELEQEIDALKTADPKVVIGLELFFPVEAPPAKKPATMKDLVDLMTLLASKGADLKRLETYYTEIIEVEDSDE